jgi:four helix bundle protein
VRDFRELEVWKKSMDLAATCYRESDSFPTSERFGLTTQLRRSAVSIPSNIAEGSGRGSARDFVRFLHIAYGSACEVETQAIIANRLGIGDTRQLSSVANDADEIRGMLHVLIQRVQTDYKISTIR